MTRNQLRVASYFWSKGFGTLFIANHLAVKESTIYNHIEFIKTLARNGK